MAGGVGRRRAAATAINNEPRNGGGGGRPPGCVTFCAGPQVVTSWLRRPLKPTCGIRGEYNLPLQLFNRKGFGAKLPKSKKVPRKKRMRA